MLGNNGSKDGNDMDSGPDGAGWEPRVEAEQGIKKEQ